MWNQTPFVRLLLPFLAGILLAIYCPLHNIFILLSSLIFGTIVITTTLVKKFNFSYKTSWLYGFNLNLFLFLIAHQITLLNTEIYQSNHYTKHTTTSTQLAHIKVTEPYQEKDKSLKMVVEVKAIKNNNGWINTSGKAMAYIQKDERALHISYGDELIIQCEFNEIPPPQNPGEFNYKRFLAFHNVYKQAYVTSEKFVNTGINSGNSIIRESVHLRNKLLKIMTDNNIKGNEFAVGSALLLGFEDKLDADIISAYSSTGALHVLSVSGLHVAIVYFIFNWLLFFLDKIKNGNIIKAFILILLLWFYAALTGLSPSVLRAATMFSFIIIGKAYNHYTNIYNTLAASAFFLLAIDPYLIMQVGFQLSYLAVIGIVYIQPKLYNLFEVNNWLLDQIWTITSVSIAAQIATFPLGLHYFHQFPNYFLLSNLVVIPISTAIVYMGIALFVFSKITFMVTYIAMAFNWCVLFLNQSVIVIEKWPYSLLQGISISVFETWLLYGVIIVFLYYFISRKFSHLVFVLSCCILIFISQIVEQHEQFNQKKLIIYNVPKTSAIDFIHSKNNVLLTDTAFAHNQSRLLFHVKHNWWDLGINNNQIISNNITTNNLFIKDNFIQFYDKKIALIKTKNQATNKNNVITLDYLIISNNANVRINDIAKQYHSKLIVFDSSNSFYKIKKWKSECEKLNQKYYSVIDSGALTINI
ncbi:MAG: ComEC/Rec2 family competence protein [Bacteroidia bacterium]